MTAELKEYYRELDKHLNCPRKLRQGFKKETQRMADELVNSHPDAAPEDVSAFLGDPAALAESFQATIEPEVLSQYRKRRTWGLRLALAGLVLVLCAGGGLGWAKWSEYAQYRDMFDDIKDADLVIIQHGPEKISEEEARTLFEEAGVPFPGDGE